MQGIAKSRSNLAQSHQSNKKARAWIPCYEMVGATGFEPAT